MQVAIMSKKASIKSKRSKKARTTEQERLEDMAWEAQMEEVEGVASDDEGTASSPQAIAPQGAGGTNLDGAENVLIKTEQSEEGPLRADTSPNSALLDSAAPVQSPLAGPQVAEAPPPRPLPESKAF